MSQPPAFLSKILISEEEIQQKVTELAAQISADYAAILEPGEAVYLLGALKGVFMFMADLCRHLTIPVTIHFMDVKNMESHTRATGITEVESHITHAITNHHVLLLEDIIDAGLSLNYLVRSLNLAAPKSLTVATMFSKETMRVITTHIKYSGFDVGKNYVVGYGLDYKEKYRNLPYLGVLHPDEMGRRDG